MTIVDWDKKEICLVADVISERLKQSAGYSTIYLFMVYFTMLRVAHAAQSNKRIIGE
jgi:hypothetical protein